MGMAPTMCPATMCPLFAADGSPWTGEKNVPCIGKECDWFGGLSGKPQCDGATAAFSNVVEMTVRGRALVVAKHATRIAQPTTFDCPRAPECQWQAEAAARGVELCPPRTALAFGVDPRACGY